MLIGVGCCVLCVWFSFDWVGLGWGLLLKLWFCLFVVSCLIRGLCVLVGLGVCFRFGFVTLLVLWVVFGFVVCLFAGLGVVVVGGLWVVILDEFVWRAVCWWSVDWLFGFCLHVFWWWYLDFGWLVLLLVGLGWLG